MESQISALLGILFSTSTSSFDAITSLYAPTAKLTTPFLILTGSEEIAKSYEALHSANSALEFSLESLSSSINSVRAVLMLVCFPKAIGGKIPIKIHMAIDFIFHQDKIIEHIETHLDQRYNIQNNNVKQVFGRMSSVGTEVVRKTGVLEYVPWAFSVAEDVVDNASKIAEKSGLALLYQKTSDLVFGATSSAAQTVSKISDRVVALQSSVKTHVIQIQNSIHVTAASLIEKGQGVHVICYSSTCSPGVYCYSPTCVRGRVITMNVNVENLSSVIKGMYLSAEEGTAGVLKNIADASK